MLSARHSVSARRLLAVTTVVLAGLAPAGAVATAAPVPPAVASTSDSREAVPAPPGLVPGEVPRAACGSPLDDAEVRRLAELTAPDATPAATVLEQYERRVARSRAADDLLAAHGDRRGVFGVGLDEVSTSAVLPLQRPGVAPDPEWARRLSLDLLDRYLAALHGHFTGTGVEPHWERFLSLALDCRQRPTFVAMTGYNAHLTVDLARAVAASGSRPELLGGYLQIVGAIADHAPELVERTRRDYGADIGPLFHFYVVGDVADAAAGSAGGSPALLRFADQAYSSLTYAHGLALRDPALHGAAEGQVLGLWTDADVALQSVTALGGL